MAWAQTPREKGALPVGRVISIERKGGLPRFPDEYPTPAQEVSRGVVGTYWMVPLVIVAAPVVLADEAMKSGLPADETADVKGHIYRHRVRLAATGEEVERDEFWTYRVGDCVAIRSEPDMLVPALPDQCD